MKRNIGVSCRYFQQIINIPSKKYLFIQGIKENNLHNIILEVFIMNFTLTQKERMLLEDQKTHEQFV